MPSEIKDGLICLQKMEIDESLGLLPKTVAFAYFYCVLIVAQ